MSVDELLVRAGRFNVPIPERIAAYRQIVAEPKAKRAVRAEAAVAGLVLEFAAADGSDPTVAAELATRTLAGFDLLQKKDRQAVWRLASTACDWFGRHDQRDHAVAVFLRYLDFQPLKTAWPEEAVTQIPRFVDDPRVLERVGTSVAKLPKKLAASQAEVLASLRPRQRWQSGSRIPQVHPSSPRIGGAPSLPADRPWPRDAAGRPMQFLAHLCFDMLRFVGGPDHGALLLFAADEALRNREPGPTLFDQCAAEYVLDTSVPLVDPAPIVAELNAAFGGPVVAEACDYFGHKNLQPISGDDYRFATMVAKASPAERAKWTAQQFNLSADHQIGGYPRFDGMDPRSSSDEPELDVLLLQLDSDPRSYGPGMQWPHRRIQFVIPKSDLDAAEFGRVHLIA